MSTRNNPSNKAHLPKPGIYKKGELKYEDLVASAQEKVKGESGALGTYIGIVKSPGRSGLKVKGLLIETYPKYSDKALQKICDEIKNKYELSLTTIYHFEGEFDIGETLVIVIVAGKGRDNIFTALEEAIHRYKTELAIWKKEIYPDGSSKWVNK